MVDGHNILGIGRLEIIETYTYYDGPVLFSCKNAAGHLYLAVAVAENEGAETWFYAGISLKRLNLIRSGVINLYDAFAKPEDGFLFRVLISKDNQSLPMTRPIQACKVSDFMLPVPSERLNFTTELSL